MNYTGMNHAEQKEDTISNKSLRGDGVITATHTDGVEAQCHPDDCRGNPFLVFFTPCYSFTPHSSWYHLWHRKTQSTPFCSVHLFRAEGGVETGVWKINSVSSKPTAGAVTVDCLNTTPAIYTTE